MRSIITCSHIDYIARKTKNRRAVVVNALGERRLRKIYELADIYHSDNFERVSDDFIGEAVIQNGEFDNVSFRKDGIIHDINYKGQMAFEKF